MAFKKSDGACEAKRRVVNVWMITTLLSLTHKVKATYEYARAQDGKPLFWVQRTADRNPQLL